MMYHRICHIDGQFVNVNSNFEYFFLIGNLNEDLAPSRRVYEATCIVHNEFRECQKRVFITMI